MKLFFTNQYGKKLTLRRAGQIETTESSSKQSVQLALCVCGGNNHLISFDIIDNDDADNEYRGIPTWLRGNVP